MPAPSHSPPWPGVWILSGYLLDAPRWGTPRAWEDGAIRQDSTDLAFAAAQRGGGVHGQPVPPPP